MTIQTGDTVTIAPAFCSRRDQGLRLTVIEVGDGVVTARFTHNDKVVRLAAQAVTPAPATNDLATSTGTVGLNRIAAHLTEAMGSHFHVENLGGGVMALVDYSGLTVTLNDGRPVLDDTEAPASVLVCLDGAGIATGTASTPAEVVAIVRTAYAATGS